MTTITTDDLELDLDEPIIPKHIGLCSNFIGAFEACGKQILEGDIEMVELPMKNNRRQFICGACADRLLGSKPAILESEPEKGKASGHGRTGARLSTGPEGKK